MKTDYYVGLLLLGACFLFLGILGAVAAVESRRAGDPLDLVSLIWIAGFGFSAGGLFMVLARRSYLKERAAPPGAAQIRPPLP